MTDQTGEIGSDDWQRLITAREMYTRSASIHYDEVLDQVAQRAQSAGSTARPTSDPCCCSNADEDKYAGFGFLQADIEMDAVAHPYT